MLQMEYIGMQNNIKRKILKKLKALTLVQG